MLRGNAARQNILAISMYEDQHSIFETFIRLGIFQIVTHQKGVIGIIIIF